MKENLVALEIRFKGLQLVFQVMAKQAKKKKKTSIENTSRHGSYMLKDRYSNTKLLLGSYY
jgi:hypothetical protein